MWDLWVRCDDRARDSDDLAEELSIMVERLVYHEPLQIDPWIGPELAEVLTRTHDLDLVSAHILAVEVDRLIQRNLGDHQTDPTFACLAHKQPRSVLREETVAPEGVGVEHHANHATRLTGGTPPASFVTLADLAARGPFAPIFIPAEQPDHYKDWLSNTHQHQPKGKPDVPA
jgi:hypothetical protein